MFSVMSTGTFRRLSRAFLLSFILLASSGLLAQSGTASALTRYQAEYTPIYSDNVETVGTALAPGFVFGPAGAFTSNPSEVILGKASIKGSYSGNANFTQYLQTNPSVIPLMPNHSYQVTFQYKILTAPSNGFQVLFFSQTGANQGNFLPSTTVTGAPGSTGTATLTNTLSSYSDYEALWTIGGTGAISIDNIQLIDVATGKVIATENAEGMAPTVGSGLQLQNGASVITDPSLVIAGQGSILLADYGTVATVPIVVSVSGNTTYIAEFQYRILNPGSGATVLHIWFQPAGTTDPQLQVSLRAPLKNSAPTGTFSTGALTAGAASYILNISATADSSVIIDNFSIFRQDAVATSAAPSNWVGLDRLPFPRLGMYIFDTPADLAQFPEDGTPPFTYSQDQLESRLAFADVIAGVQPGHQANEPDFVRRIRKLNPNAVFLPYRISEEQGFGLTPLPFSNVSLEYLFQQSVADDWSVRDTKGNYVVESDYPFIHLMNISPFCPVDNGQGFTSAVLNWLTASVFSSGLWDGVFFDNLFGRINPHIPNSGNPALLDYDWNRNGTRDETPASTSDMTRNAAIQILQDFRAKTGGLQLVIGNPGAMPELPLAQYVNGYLFEGFNSNWEGPSVPTWESKSPEMWRAALDAYRKVQQLVRKPAINLIQSNGPGPLTPVFGGNSQITPTAADLHRHRFTMGTALLGDGFYFYNLVGDFSPPYFYDEYAVDGTGTAVEDRSKKGYLGQALTDAVELASSSTLIFSEDFEDSTLPASFYPGSQQTTVAISQLPSEVISGTGSLVISNPDHTQQSYNLASTVPGALQFIQGNAYRVVFDYRIIETLDGPLHVDFWNFSSNSAGLALYLPPGVVAGDSGTADFPVTITSSGNWSLRIGFFNGGGKIAVDNLRVYQGGVGPWRRDFENGLVLVNPFLQSHTFSAADLAGVLKRTGIHRIKGTQAPDINNGQPVTGSLTLAPFDAIVLLADPIRPLAYSGQVVSASGSGGSVSLTFPAGFAWTASTAANWITFTGPTSGTGNGTLTYQVTPNDGADRSATITVGGFSFTVEQQAASIPGLAFIGSMPHIAAEENWTTTFALVNKGAAPAQARMSFFGDPSGTLTLPLGFPQVVPAPLPLLATSFDRTLEANASLIIDTAGPQTPPVQVGSAQMASTGAVDGFAIFHEISTAQEAVVPMETRNANSYLLAFDNTGGVVLGVALENVSAQAADVAVLIRDDTGVLIGPPGAMITLAGSGHTSFVLSTQFPITANKRGTIEFDTPSGGQISALGIRFTPPNNAMTTIPVLANVGTSGGSIAHIATGNGWQTTFVLVNAGTSAAHAHLAFFADNGSPLSLPLSFPQSADGTTTAASTVDQTLAAGATLIVQSAAPLTDPLPTIGSAQLTTSGNVGGFVIFRYNLNGQEAVVPLESRTADAYLLAFDNTNGTATGVAINTVSTQAVNIPVVIRDDTGAQIGADTLNLAAEGHLAFTLVNKYPATANIRGTLEFDTPAGGQIGVLGIRSPIAHTFTTLPALAK